MRRVRLVLADDDAAVMEALAQLFEADRRFHVVAKAGTGDELIALATAHSPDLALLDLGMPGGGSALIRALRSGAERLRILVFTSATSFQTVSECVAAGVAGLTCKGDDGEFLLELAYRCAHGEFHLAFPQGQLVAERLLSSP